MLKFLKRNLLLVMLAAIGLWLYLKRAGGVLNPFPTADRATEHFAWHELGGAAWQDMAGDAFETDGKTLTETGKNVLALARFGEAVRAAFGDLPVVLTYRGTGTDGVIKATIRPLLPNTGGRTALTDAIVKGWAASGGNRGGTQVTAKDGTAADSLDVDLSPAPAIWALYDVGG